MHHSTLSVHPARRRLGFTLPRLAAGLAAVLLIAVPHGAAQTQVFTFDTHYTASNVNQFSSGSATVVDYDHHFGTSWNTSINFGGFSTGLFGDEWGAGGTAFTNGSVGFDVLFRVNGGLINLNLPNKISIAVPTDTSTGTLNVGFTQDRSGIGSGNFFTTQFPNIELGLDASYHLNAGVTGRVAYGVGDTSGTITMTDLAHLYGAATGNPILATTDPFNNDLNLVSYNVDGNHTLTVLGLGKDLGNGFTKQLNSNDLLKIPGYPDFPTKVEFGSITLNPVNSSLNAASGNSMTVTVNQTTLLAASVDVLGLASLAMGLPINPFEPKISIPGTPITFDATLLDVDSSIHLGLKQTLTLLPRTFVGLSSNHPVGYSWTDGSGAHTATTTDLLYLLPNDGSASTLQITSKPADADWQLFSRVFIDPQLLNQLYLTISGQIDIQALAASLSAYGASAGFGPLVSTSYNLFTADILLNSVLVDLQAGSLSRVYRNPRPLFGAGIQQNLTVDANDRVQFFDQSGTFATTAIDGTLTMRNSLFLASNPITVTGTLDLDGVFNDFETPTLNVASTGTVRVDSGSQLFVTSATTPGFVDAAGAITSGTYVIGGLLGYSGPDITSIGSGVHVELLPGGLGSDLAWRVSNGGATGHDAFTTLSNNAGYLFISGQDLALTGALTNSGALTVTNGHALSTVGNFTNVSGGSVTVGDDSMFTVGGAWANVGGGTLGNIDLTLGGDTAGGVLRYFGAGPATLAGTTRLVLSGARPVLYDNNGNPVANGYLLGGAGGLTDAVVSLTASAGTLRLQHGATQTLAGSLASSGALEVADSGSALGLTGTLTNTGTVTLTGGGAITAGGTLGNLNSGTLTGGTWNLGGVLNYTGADITGIASGTNVILDGSGHGFRNAGANAFNHFSFLDGSLTVTGGASLATDSALALNGTLTLAAGATVSANSVAVIANGLNLTGASLTLLNGMPGGSFWTFAGPLTLGGTLTYGGSPLTNLTGGTRIDVRSGGALVNGGLNGFRSFSTLAGTLDVAAGGNLRTDASLDVASGGTLTLGADGTLQVTGATFSLGAGATFNQNGGTLVLGGAGTQTSFSLANGFSFTDGTVSLGQTAFASDNTGPYARVAYVGTTGTGQLLAAGGTRWTNAASIVGAGAITGGAFTNQGSLFAGGGTLTVSGLDGPLVNTGLLGSAGTPTHPGRLELNDLTLQNSGLVGGVPTSGRIEARSVISFANSTVNGGRILVTRLGTLESAVSTFAVDQLNVEGAFTVHAGGATSITGAAFFAPTATLTLETGATPATLAFGANSTFTNQGLINLGGGTQITGLTVVNQGRIALGAGLTTSLNNINNSPGGTIDLLDGSTLNLSTSSFANAGLIHLSGENPASLANSASTFLLTGDLTLTGGGVIQLGGYNTSTNTTAANGNPITVASTVWTNAGTGTLRSDNGNHVLTLVNQTLNGQGSFGQGTISIDNQAGGAIGVLGNGSVLDIQTDSGGLRNRGTLNVGVGATMNISGGPFLSLAGGALTEGTYRVGGTLVIPGIGTGFNLGNTSGAAVALTFDGSNPGIYNPGDLVHAVTFDNILATGSFTRVNGTTTLATSAGTPFVNSGLLSAGSSGNEAVTPGTIDITGGHFTNFANGTLTGGRYSVAGLLKFDGADIVTNAADLTMRYQGQIQDQSGQDALRNFATNNGTFSLRTGAFFTVGAGVGTFTQNGTINVDPGSQFNLGGVATFNSSGSIHIAPGGYMNLAGATVNNLAAATPDYWIGGTLTGGNWLNTAGAHLTLFGPGAAWNRNGDPNPPLGNDGTLTFAGGYSATYTSTTDHLTNHGLWEIGSTAAIDGTGNTGRSAAQVTFGGPLDTPIVWDNTGTITYYGGVPSAFSDFINPPTDDGTRSLFKVSNLFIDGGATSAGRLDAVGEIFIVSGGRLELNGTLANSLGRLFIDSNINGATLKITGGLDLANQLDLSNVTLDFTPVAGKAITLDGIYLPGAINLGTYNHSQLTLRHNAALVNNATGLSALQTLAANDSTITLDHTIAETFPLAFLNFGTLHSVASSFIFQAGLDNRGTVDATLNVTGDLHNLGTITGAVTVSGDLWNDRNFVQPSELNLAGMIQGNLINDHGLVHEGGFGGLRVGGVVQNIGELHLGTNSIMKADLSAGAPIVNDGELFAHGTISNALSSSGNLNIDAGSATELTGNNGAFFGRIFVGDGASLSVASDLQLGHAPAANVNPWLTLGAGTIFTFGGPLAPNRTVRIGAGSAITGTTPDSAIPAGVSALGDLTVAGHLATQLSMPNSATLTLAGTLELLQAGFFGQSVQGAGSILNLHGYTLSLGGGATFNGSVANSATSLLLIGGTAFTPDIANDGTTSFNGGGTLAYDGATTGTGELRVMNNTTLTLALPATQASFRIDAGSSLQVTGFANLTGSVLNNGNLTFARDGDIFTVGSNLTGTGSITQAGTGSFLILPGLNLAGGLTIAHGSVQIGDGTALSGTVSAPITNQGNLWFNHTGAINVTGDIGGAGTLEHIGPGTLTLTGAKTYTGKTSVGSDFVPAGGTSAGGGTLSISGDSSLGAAPASFVSDQLLMFGGTTLNLLNNTTLAATRGFTAQGNVTITGASLTALGGIAGDAGSSLTYNGGAASTLTVGVGAGSHYTPHDLTIGDNATVALDNLGTPVVLDTAINGTINSYLTFQGGGATTVRTTGNYAGQTLIAADTTVRLGSGTATGSVGSYANILGTLELGRTDNVTYSGFFGNGTIIKDQASTATITQPADSSTAFRGSLVLHDGVVQLDSYSDLGFAPTAFRADGLTFDGGTLRLTNASSGGFIDTNQGVTITSRNGTIDLPGTAVFGIYSPFAGPGMLTKTGSGTLQIGTSGMITPSFKIVDGWLTHVGTADATFAGPISDNAYLITNPAARGGFSVEHSGGGNVTLTGYNTYTGGTRVLGGGDLILGDGGTTGSILGDVQTFLLSALRYDRSDSFVLPNNVTGSGGLKQAGTGVLTIDNAQTFTGPLTVMAGTVRLTDTASLAGDIVTDSNLLLDVSGTATFANVISGTGKVTKDDTLNLTFDHGTVTLSGANTYTGLTDVKAGTLILTGANTGNGGASITAGATLRLTGAGAIGGNITGAGALELARTDDYSLDATLAGTGSVNKTGTGTATLTGAPSYSGSLAINNGTLAFASAGDGELSGDISGAGTLVKDGAGLLAISGANTGSVGSLVINGGVLQFGNGGTTGAIFAPVTLNAGGTLAFNHSDNRFQGDVIGGDGAFSQRGTGRLTFTADNTYTGGTSIFAGSTLQLGSGGTTGSIVGNVANDGLLVFNRHDDTTFAGNTSGTGTLQQSGYGLLTLTGLHTATGGAIIDSGSSLALATTATLTGPIANSGNLTILTDSNDSVGRELPVSVSGSGGLTVDGGGGLRITGDLTYAGLTTITGGSTLRLANDQTSTLSNALAGNGTFIKLGDGTLTLTADSDAFTGTVRIAQGTLQLGNGGTTGSIGGSVTSVDLESGTLAIDHSDPITIVSVISGGGGLSQLGSGRLTLTNDNTFLGDIHVGGGAELQLGLGGATGSVLGHLDVDGLILDTRSSRWDINLGLTGAGTISKTLTGNAAADVISIAGGVGSPIHFTGDVSFNGGTVQVHNDGTMGSFQADNLQVSGGANVALVGDTGFIHTVNNGTITLGNGGTTGSLGGDITGGGTLAFNRSDTFTYNGNIGGGGLRQVGPGTTIFANGNQGFTGSVQVDAGTLAVDTLIGGTVVNNGTLRLDYGRLDDGSSISGTGNVVTAATGTTVLPSDVTYTGQTNIAGGVLEVSPAGGTTTLPGLVTGPGGLRLATAGTLVLASGGTFTGATTLVYDNPAQSGPTLRIGGDFASSASGFGTIEFNNASAATASGDLSGALALVKSNAGRLTLTGHNAHLGQTRIDGGTLALGGNNTLSPDSPFLLANVADALLDLAGYTATVLTLDGGGATGGNIGLGSGRLTISPHQASGFPLDSAYAGNITGSGGITMDGFGTQTLTGQNSYTGGTTLAQGTLAVGSGSLGLGTVLFSGGSLTALGNMTFDSSRPIVLTGSGGGISVDGGANVTVNSVITGSGNFAKSGAGNLLLNAAPANSGQVYISSGTLTLGGAGILSPGQALITDGYLDLNGQNWSSALDVHGNGGVANSGAAAVTVSGTLGTWGHLSARSTGGALNLTGTIASNSGPVALYADGAGRIALGATPSANIGSITADRATLALQSPGSFTSLTGIQATNGAQLELTGGSSLPALAYLSFQGNGVMGDAGGLQNVAAGTSTRVDVTQLSAATLSFYTPNPTPGSAAFLLGGAGDLTLSGHADGNADIAKVGTGRLTLEGNYADWSGGFDVRAGTLALDAATLQNRALKLGAAGSLDFGPAADLALSSLTGDGSLHLGATNLTLNSAANFTFTGTLSTTGTLGKIGAGAGSLAAVTAGSVTVDDGSLTFTGLLTAASLTVHGGAASVAGAVAPGTLLRLDSVTGGTLSVNAASVTTNAGATFTGNVDTNGSLQLLSQAADLTANSGSITLRDGGSLNDANFVHGTLNSLTSNSGTLRALAGSSLSLGTGFTNTGTVLVSGSNSGLSAGFGSATAITQAGGSLTVGAGASVTVRHLNVTGGALVLDGVLQNFSGAPTLTLSGGSLSGSGQIFRGNLVLAGGTFSPGNSPGTFSVQQGDATFASGGTYRFEINNATGTAGTNWDLLSVGLIDPENPSGGHLNITATAGNRFTLLLVSLLGDNSAGAVLNFNQHTSYAYTFASASAGILGFDAAAFTINTSGFANAYNGSWSVAQSGNDLKLVYTAIPEPSTCAALAGLAVLGLAISRRRRA